ncbi:MAG: hypothetical protein FD165_1606 [Gammaproteobacteria bacterium]|nr:MAG: hypothetical protein FD165_1606 [Gammaproteobacteria bacterium]TND05517.1 MAG: hypothetical protein FD120_1125 [Gammaproteobacteria bacterium]
MLTLVSYLVLGSAVGVVAGLFGVGGGLIIVPALVMLFGYQQLFPDVAVHVAIGTSLATIIVTSIASTRAHHRHGAVLWDAVRGLAPGLLIGTLLGALIANLLSTNALRWVFGIFELVVAAQIALDVKPSPHRTLPGIAGMSLVGTFIGAVSSLIGIGGGTLTTPFLLWCNKAIHNAVATSAACGLPIAVGGTISFIIVGWNVTGDAPYTSGYVYWPAAAGIGAATLVFAPLGARLAHRLPRRTLKLWFAALLAVLGTRMLLG